MAGGNLPPVFGHCMSYLSKATTYLTAQDHPDALKLCLIRLRLSRWYMQVTGKSGLGTVPSEDVQAVQAEMSKIWQMLGDCRLSGRGIVPRKVLLSKIDSVVNSRLSISAPSAQYQGHIFWSVDQYRKAAGMIGELEKITGCGRLRELSAAELRTIGPDGADSLALKNASLEVDPWMRAVFANSQSSSFGGANIRRSFGHGYGVVFAPNQGRTIGVDRREMRNLMAIFENQWESARRWQ